MARQFAPLGEYDVGGDGVDDRHGRVARLGRTRVLLGLAAAALVVSAPAVAAAASVPTAPNTACCTTAAAPNS
jgi:hypothetical protein